jgi:hypothetical protein
MIRRLLVIVCLLSLAWTAPSDCRAQILRDQAVTWTDFSYVNTSATSMSHVYFATTGGIIRYDKIANRWEEPMTGADGLYGEIPVRIWVNQFDDRLFARTEFDLYEYDRLFDRWYPIDQLPNVEFNGTHIAPPIDLLPGSGINFVGENTITDYYNRTFSISDVLDDNVGNLWFGTWGQGTGMANSSARVIDLLPFGLLQKPVTTILLDGDTLFASGPVGTGFRTGVTAMDLEDYNFSYIESGVERDFPSVDVNAIESDGSYLYIGTDNGLYTASRESMKIARHYGERHGLIDYQVRSLKRLGDSLFIGTARGLNLLRLGLDTLTQVYPSQFRNYTIYDLEFTEGYVWIASEIGAYRLATADGQLQRFEDPHRVLFSRVLAIETHGDKIWFASEDGILSLDLKSGKTDPFRDIVRRSSHRALAANDDVVALASDRGMTILFLNRKKRLSRDFTTDDGLVSNYVYALELDGDYVWVGTDEGLTRFLWNNPERVD